MSAELRLICRDTRFEPYDRLLVQTIVCGYTAAFATLCAARLQVVVLCATGSSEREDRQDLSHWSFLQAVGTSRSTTRNTRSTWLYRIGRTWRRLSCATAVARQRCALQPSLVRTVSDAERPLSCREGIRKRLQRSASCCRRSKNDFVRPNEDLPRGYRKVLVSSSRRCSITVQGQADAAHCEADPE